MDSFMVAFRVVAPMAMLVGLGMLLRISKITDEGVMKNVDTISFRLFMPMLAFYNIYKTDFSQLTDVGYLLFGLVSVFILFLLAMFLVPKLVKPGPTAAAYGQAMFRSNFMIFGSAVATSIYGEGNIGFVALLGAIVVPLYNVQATILLETARQGTASKKKLLVAIAKNPTVISTVIGIAVNLSGLRVPEILLGVVQDLASMTTPMCFLSIGVSLSFGAVAKKWYVASCSLLRLVIIPLIFVTIGIVLGFRGQQLCALMLLFAAPVAVSSCPMAAAMGADREFAVQMVAYTTVLCIPTIFLWTLVLNTLGFL